MHLLDDLLATPDTPLKRAPVKKDRVQGWLKEAVSKRKDAQRAENSNSTRMDAAYDAVFFCALSALSAEGFEVSSKAGHHNVALEAAARLLCLSELFIDTVDALKTWRNRKYQASFTASQADVNEAVEVVNQYMEATSAWFEQAHPTLLK